MAIFSLSVTIIKSYSTGRKLLTKHLIFLIAFIITHSSQLFMHLFLDSEENKEVISIVFNIQTDLFIGSSNGTILTLSRLANKNLLHEIYYSMFISKSSPDYIAYRYKNSITKRRIPLKLSIGGDNMDFANASLYYDDFYTNNTFIVILM